MAKKKPDKPTVGDALDESKAFFTKKLRMSIPWGDAYILTRHFGVKIHTLGSVTGLSHREMSRCIDGAHVPPPEVLELVELLLRAAIEQARPLVVSYSVPWRSALVAIELAELWLADPKRKLLMDRWRNL